MVPFMVIGAPKYLWLHTFIHVSAMMFCGLRAFSTFIALIELWLSHLAHLRELLLLWLAASVNLYTYIRLSIFVFDTPHVFAGNTTLVFIGNSIYGELLHVWLLVFLRIATFIANRFWFTLFVQFRLRLNA